MLNDGLLAPATRQGAAEAGDEAATSAARDAPASKPLNVRMSIFIFISPAQTLSLFCTTWNPSSGRDSIHHGRAYGLPLPMATLNSPRLCHNPARVTFWHPFPPQSPRIIQVIGLTLKNPCKVQCDERGGLCACAEPAPAANLAKPAMPRGTFAGG